MCIPLVIWENCRLCLNCDHLGREKFSCKLPYNLPLCMKQLHDNDEDDDLESRKTKQIDINLVHGF